MPSASKIAIIVSHGQPSAPDPAEAALAELAHRVAACLPDWQIRSATLAKPGQLERVMEEDALVYPFFMSSGWFTSQVLPKRLQGFSYRQLSPFGQDRDLPALTAEILRQQAQARGLSLNDSGPLLLAAHGSARGPKAAEATENFAANLRQALPDCEIATGYIEEAPSLSQTAAAHPDAQLCLPFFAQSGDHVTGDIPSLLQEADFKGEILPSLGCFPEMARMIATALQKG